MGKRVKKLSSDKIAKALGANPVRVEDFKELSEEEAKQCVPLGSAQGIHFFHCLHSAFNHSEKLRQFQEKKKVGYRFGVPDKGYLLKVLFYELP